MKTNRTLFVCLLLAAASSSSTVLGQRDPYGDYDGYDNAGGGYDGYGQDQDYGQDNLYHDYAARQEEKAGGAAPAGPGWMKLFGVGSLSWFLGAKFHSGRVLSKAKQKFQKEQKQLYSQYYNDVYKLTEQNQELQYLVEQFQDALKKTKQEHELEALQRDYDEFKQPDIDGDDRISRAEFNMYVKNYLSHYPGLTEKDYPKFEDFDHDGDGYVSFQEYAQQMALQAQQAEKEALKTGNKDKAAAYNDMAGGAGAGGGGANKQQATGTFEDVYKQYL